MRDGMMINSILANSSVWYSLTEKQLTELEVADEYLIRKIMNCHAKVPKEFLYQDEYSFLNKFFLQLTQKNYF